MDTTLAFPLLVGLVLLALAFDFLNGLHDAANSIATVVSTKLMKPVQAVAFAAFFNFAAYFLTLWFPSLHKVAETIGKGIIDKDLVTPAVVFGALCGAMFWNVLTWVKGIPSSSSHALVGGIVGAGLAHAGLEGIQWAGLNKTLIAIVLSPTLGMLISMLIVLISSWMLRNTMASRAERGMKTLHIVSSAAYSLSHGLNDAQSINAFADKVRAALQTPHQLGEVVAQSTGSVGWAVFPDDGADMARLLSVADQRMYTDKQRRTQAAVPA